MMYPISVNGLWGFVSHTGSMEITPRYLAAGEFAGSRAAVRTPTGWGFIDEFGDMVIDPVYSYADEFSEGLAAVRVGTEWGFVDSAGRIILDPKFGDVLPFSEGVAMVGGAEPAGKRVYRYVNRAGETAVPGTFELGGNFTEGLAPVKSVGSWGFIDHEGRIVVPFEYWYVREFSEGLGYLDRGDGTYPFFVDRHGRFQFESPGLIRDVFHEGLAPVSEESMCGYMDKTGKLVIPEQFPRAFGFHEGAATVQETRRGPWGAIDRDGQILIPFSYDEVGEFRGGVMYFRCKGENGYVDKRGHEVARFPL